MFQIVWLQTALNDLAAMWIKEDSKTRQAITLAAHAVDQELKINPKEQGESRDAEERIFFAFPLGLQFEINYQESVVRILHVWDIRRRK